MTKSKKQREHDAHAAHDRQKMFVLAAAIVTMLIIIFATTN